jgi:hypothetical protein
MTESPAMDSRVLGLLLSLNRSSQKNAEGKTEPFIEVIETNTIACTTILNQNGAITRQQPWCYDYVNDLRKRRFNLPEDRKPSN